ncbi:MAG: phage terminase small subunit P27 family [Bosea sp.]|uniref:phage terminase small subunit P27 family n=1 Tax=Bosea sp. (in: a-proteobacteria) TaxID=1871050 RepID=UPI001AD40E71|nr:phage terminase small subunit P27 family [Bosea sp. (in: a-proteobacteria)]MBN9470665.1 phage terminase small subunit P27 family [Bosea sp. (in: a-proteobacteria)]
MRGRRPTELKAIEGGLSGRAPLPADVPKVMRSEWDRIVSDLASRKLLTPATLGTVAAYLIARWQVAECVKAIQQDGAFVKTKGGEPKPHPAHGVMNKAQEIVARLAAELGLTPAARSRRGLSGPAEGGEANDGAPAGLGL